MEKTAKDFAHIPGWGIDADPKNEPTYPNRHRTGEEHDGRSWVRPTQQVIQEEVLHSIERPDYTAVVGNSVPPSGLSGMIRRFAFKYSENSYLHWLPLLMADKVNVVEGILDDFAHGTVPNIFAEKGYKAQWKYDKKSLILKMATLAAVVGGTVVLLSQNNGKRRPSSQARYKRNPQWS
ncbi:hypothetical protein AUC43_04135 [Hymenobacter sedentarius]|uniref:Uncharacterized protein n=1 Tax=Hymenobacter sedentarius TaxID=1411621 RepID=A0A0U4AUF3_9BACT|nr:hypothetical protein [Hymenobacter sedentarius]ALW84349.1 hypothetical protein AUC43_04135 [Hymenobacter sedentarius]